MIFARSLLVGVVAVIGYLILVALAGLAVVWFRMREGLSAGVIGARGLPLLVGHS